MARQFILENPLYDIQSLDSLRKKWKNIPDHEVRDIIVISEQYFHFSRYILCNLRHKDVRNKLENSSSAIMSYVRACMIKSCLEVATSIFEIVLESHAVHRQYKLPKIKSRTFGNILKCWENNEGAKNEILPYIEELNKFKRFRDHIHLSKIKYDNPDFYMKLLTYENLYFNTVIQLLDYLAKMNSI